MTANGTRRRLTGVLAKRHRGYLLTCDNGDVWVVDFSDGLQIPAGEVFTIEGVQQGIDRVLADWVSSDMS